MCLSKKDYLPSCFLSENKPPGTDKQMHHMLRTQAQASEGGPRPPLKEPFGLLPLKSRSVLFNSTGTNHPQGPLSFIAAAMRQPHGSCR